MPRRSMVNTVLILRLVRFALILGGLAILLAGAAVWLLRGQEQRDVPYSFVSEQTLHLDVYEPGRLFPGPRPAILLIHGGAWGVGNKNEVRDLARTLAQIGYVAVGIQYRLASATRNQWPAQLEDCQHAVRWMRAHAADLRINPDSIGVIGFSAGGHLASCLGTMMAGKDPDPALNAYSPAVQCVISLSGPSDLAHVTVPDPGARGWVNEALRNLLGAAPAERPDLAKAASPLYSVSARSAPTLLVQGRRDPLVPVSQAEWLFDALKRNGVEAELMLHAGGHGIEDAGATIEFAKRAHRFLARHLRPSGNVAIHPEGDRD